MPENFSLIKTILRKNPNLEIRRSPVHRWGVFAKEQINEYDLLEETPYFEVPNDQIESAPECERYSYWLTDNSQLIGMGYAGLYNHSGIPNASYEIDYVNQVIRHYSILQIEADQEITLDYGKNNVDRFVLN
jgi:SET domain-containing protein